MTETIAPPGDEWARSTEDGDTTFADRVRRVRLEVTAGADARASVESTGDRLTLGAHPSNDLVLKDPLVSRFHCELTVLPEGPLVRDLGSRNGTFIGGIRVKEGYLQEGNPLRVGRTTIELRAQASHNRVSLSPRVTFGAMTGRSSAMRAVFALLEKAAASAATVLLEGETGTGKGAAAEAVHTSSDRRGAPFVIVDCGAIPPTLLESELFGHEKGAFTGADTRRIGAFEAANGGTVFIDEIGELAADLQPKLLRVLEARTVRRVGSNHHVPIDVRVIAATNRDLRAEVNAGRFRADLYYRLAVIKVVMPPLRKRAVDLADLCRNVLMSLRAHPEQVERLLSPPHLQRMEQGGWPGNVRELRNYLERCLVFDDAPPPSVDGVSVPSAADPRLSFAEARKRALDTFEAAYVTSLLGLHGGNVRAAAQAAGINRVYLYRLVRRHGLRGGGEEEG